MKNLTGKVPIYIILGVLLIILIFKNWFISGILASGDFWPHVSVIFPQIYFPINSWSWNQGEGIGGSTIPFLSSYILLDFPIWFFVNILGIPWQIVERVLYFFPFLILSTFGSILLSKKAVKDYKYYLLSPFIFLLNTYILLVIGGGQVFIALSYALSPIVLYLYIKLIDNLFYKESFENHISFLKTSFAVGLLYGLQITLDIRIAYTTFLIVLIYFCINLTFLWENSRRRLLNGSVFIFTSLLTAFLVNSYWIIPLLITHSSSFDTIKTFTPGGNISFFSFSKIEQSISLLHPNWPENIFGKVNFMKPEFLLLPILAFSSLLFIKRKEKKEKVLMSFFAITAIIGSFLSKGTNDPFGSVYQQFFNHIPGFNLFRDPTKWYVMTATAYSVSIPYAIRNIALSIKNKLFSRVFLVFLVFIFLWMIRDAWLGHLGGNFRNVTIPQEYMKLNAFISSQKKFSRILWIPQNQRFGFRSENHPAISADVFFRSSDINHIIKDLKKNDSERMLQNLGISYVVVPYDSQGEIFLNDRKYSKALWESTVKKMGKINYLEMVPGFSRIAVFRIHSVKDHFWTPSENVKISYSFLNPAEYRVTVKNARKGDMVIFSDGFNSLWEAKTFVKGNYSKKTSVKYEISGFKVNSFSSNMDGDYTMEVYFAPQHFIYIYLWASGVVVLFCFLIIIYSKKK